MKISSNLPIPDPGNQPIQPICLIIHNLRITPPFSTLQETENSFILVLIHSSSQQTGHTPVVKEELPTLVYNYHSKETVKKKKLFQSSVHVHTDYK